ncbi:MAG: hypothetical protein ACLGIT_12530 [Gammaproteobacteria bacterium]
MSLRRRDAMFAAATLPWWATPATASLPAPDGAVVLSVGGAVRAPNAGAEAHFDMAMLAALPQHELRVPTPWYDGPRLFTGPLLRDVLDRAGAHGTMLRARALNNYRVDIPVEDVRRWDVVLARLLDGRPMSVREKGPLFVMYPFDRHDELRNGVYYGRCIWQLRSIEVR